MPYFSIVDDLKYPFFCKACLTGKPESERSAREPKYCNGCQAVIEGERLLRTARLDPDGRQNPLISPSEPSDSSGSAVKKINTYQNRGKGRPAISISPQQREIIENADYSLRGAAAVMGVSYGTVRNMRRRTVEAQ